MGVEEGIARNDEYNIPASAWFNFFDGLGTTSNTAVFECFNNMTDDEKVSYQCFLEEVNAMEASAIEGLNVERPFILPDKLTVLRFLQADKYDRTLAMERIRDTMIWHQSIGLHDIVTKQPSKLDAYRRFRVRLQMGYSKTGMPIFVERMAQFMTALDSKEGKELTEQDFIDSALYEMGDVIRAIRDQPHLTDTSDNACTGKAGWAVGWIMDFRGISFLKAHRATPVIKLLSKLIEPRFPEIAGPIYLVNVPRTVVAVWYIVRAFLHASVVEKIQIHSGIPLELLLEQMDESMIFREFGGTNDSDFREADFS